jgi:putative nucleotidyltransferase with HDIG domain
VSAASVSAPVFVVDEAGLRRNQDLIASLHGSAVMLETLRAADVADRQIVVFDIDLTRIESAKQLRGALKGGQHGQLRVFAVNYMRRLEMIYANIFGATRLLRRPLQETRLRHHLAADLAAQHSPASHSASADAGDGVHTSIASAADALQDLFGAISTGGAFDLDTVDDAGGAVVEAIVDTGFAPWIETVRAHHESTFQHCLIVTGLATTFAHATGMSHSDTVLLTRAGMLHDVGKASIPIEILDKPGKLTASEMDVVKTHPGLGYDYLRTQGTVGYDMLTAVRSHHEYLDGSGYPDGLMLSQIGDIPRIVTICDVLGALLERRSYKPPMERDAAIEILYGMADDGKVERPLVGAMQRALEAA